MSNLAKLEDRFAITDALHRYCHGVDRCDVETLKSAFWEDGTDDHGDGAVPAHAFSEALMGAIGSMRCTQHTVSNIMIDLRSETEAVSQSYCVAYHQFDTEDGPQEMVVGGRYLDTHEKRDGEWKILSRVYLMDWNRNLPSAAIWAGGLYDQLKHRGARYPDDLSKGYVG